ncbi:MAG: HAD family hydrolase [Clostridiales bacterium]|nr:HAD family hydrolase [Clostridiales bacterium]
MAINTITIDFYGTLVRNNDAMVREVCRKISQTAHKIMVSPGEVGIAWWRIVEDILSTKKFYDSKKLEKMAIERLITQFHSAEDAEELYNDVITSLRRPMLYSDTMTFLERLPLPIVIITNGDLDIIKDALAFSQIEAAQIICSGEVKSYKPSKTIFVKAIELIKMQPDEILHVGDSLKYDITPAKEAGMHTCWINRMKKPMKGNHRPDIECDTLLDLRMIIK